MPKSKTLSKLSSMNCAQCGSCCIDPMIEVTDQDLRRLVKHLGVPADRLVKLYDTSELDCDNEQDWISLSYGKRQLGLRKKSNGDCILLSEKRQCTAYEARPLSCRVFPIDIVLDEDNEIIDFELSEVVRKKHIKCKHFYGKPGSFKGFRKTSVQSRNETVSYWKRLHKWNKLTEKGGKADFLKFLGL